MTSLKREMNWPLPVLLLLTAAGLSFAFYKVLTPDTYTSPPSSPISYIFVPDEDGRTDKAHLVWGMFWTPAGRELDVDLVFRNGHTSPFEEITMERVRGTKVFVGSLPGQAMGQRAFYYLRVRDSERNEVLIPAHAPGKPLLYVTFKGTPDKWALIAHIVFTFVALFFLAHALYYALRILGRLARKKETGRCFINTVAGWIALAVSTLPLGIYISLATFGQGWTGWPLGPDITDTKSLLLVIYWAVPVLMFWRKKIEEKALSWLVVIGFLLTGAAYLIPHSYFFQ